MIEYDFVKGLYRAKIKTTYKRDDMSMTNFIYSDLFKFTSNGREINIFEDGQFNPKILYPNFDISDYRSNIPVDPLGAATNPNSLSAYFLTEHPLFCGQHYAEPFYIENDYLRKDGLIGYSDSMNGEKCGYTRSMFFIPIKRINGVKSVSYVGKTLKYNSMHQVGDTEYNLLSLGAGAIVNNSMQYVQQSYQRYVREWTQYIVDVSSLPYVDYLYLLAYDGSPAYKDITLLFE